MNYLFVASFLLSIALASGTELSKNDVDILNVALNLECLKAQFYSFAAYGTGLTRAQRGNGPAPIGGKRALLSPSALKLARDIANDEINHVKFFRDLLTRKAVPCPLVNIGSSFQVAADAAFDTTLDPAFDPYASDILFYHAAFLLEDLGVTAYTTGVSNLEDSAAILAVAGVLATEGYHAGAIRDRLIDIADQFVFPYAANVTTIINAISTLRADLAGGKDGGLSPLVPADPKYSIAYSRTINEILRAVYFDENANRGGFFPNGLNGFYK